MFRIYEYFGRYGHNFSSPWWFYLLMGINLILFAVLIIVFPELIALLVASVIMLLGALLVAAAIRMRKSQRKGRNWEQRYWIDF